MVLVETGTPLLQSSIFKGLVTGRRLAWEIRAPWFVQWLAAAYPHPVSAVRRPLGAPGWLSR